MTRQKSHHNSAQSVTRVKNASPCKTPTLQYCLGNTGEWLIAKIKMQLVQLFTCQGSCSKMALFSFFFLMQSQSSELLAKAGRLKIFLKQFVHFLQFVVSKSLFQREKIIRGREEWKTGGDKKKTCLCSLWLFSNNYSDHCDKVAVKDRLV